MKTKILFICRYNRFRSRVAEAYFNKINKNRNIVAKSAGLIKGEPLKEAQILPAKALGLDIRGKTKGLTPQILKWQNVIVVVADDVPAEVFRGKKETKKLIVFKIKDGDYTTLRSPEKVAIEVMKKVDKLANQLNKMGRRR